MTENVYRLRPTIEDRAAQAMLDYASGKTTAIKAVIEYGKALLEGRVKYSSDNAFSKWVSDNKLDVGKPWADRFERHCAMKIAELGVGKLPTPVFDNCTNTTPTNIMKWYREKNPNPDKPKRNRSGNNKRTAAQVDAAYEGIKKIKETTGAIPTQDELVKTLKMPRLNIRMALERIEGEQAGANQAVTTESAMLAKFEAEASDKSKLTLKDAIRIHTARLDKSFQTKVSEEVRKQIAAADEATRKENSKLRKENLAVTMLLQQRTIFTADDYKTILRCLHPDNSASTALRARAFDLVKQKENRLTGTVT